MVARGRKLEPRCFRGVKVKPGDFKDESSAVKELVEDSEDQGELNSEE